MATNQPILQNGVAKCDTVERIGVEYISIQYIVSYDNVSDTISISKRVNGIHLEQLARDMQELSV